MCIPSATDSEVSSSVAPLCDSSSYGFEPQRNSLKFI
uniref:Uncharacterized protein n=1 Tax=Anguilla anguilla TaxID=7936 RepID=A0A0E9VZ46_ANGAN